MDGFTISFCISFHDYDVNKRLVLKYSLDNVTKCFNVKYSMSQVI